MKTNIALTVCLSFFLSLVGCMPMRTIEGDGNVITEKIEIAGYETLKTMGGKMVVDYTQSAGTPELTITTDKNIFDIYTFKVEDGVLNIKPQQKYWKAYRIKPTVFTVTTNSATIREFKLAGETRLNVNSPLTTDKLEINIAGSGHVNMQERLEASEVETDLAGSGTIDIADIAVTKYSADIAGNGTLILGGQAEKVNLSIAGSGETRAMNLQAKELACSIAGNGDVEISVSDKIKADIVGSGEIRYKGEPVIEKSVAGSGKIKKVE